MLFKNQRKSENLWGKRWELKKRSNSEKLLENECFGKVSHFFINVPKPTENLRKFLKKFWEILKKFLKKSEKILKKIWEIFLPGQWHTQSRYLCYYTFLSIYSHPSPTCGYPSRTPLVISLALTLMRLMPDLRIFTKVFFNAKFSTGYNSTTRYFLWAFLTEIFWRGSVKSGKTREATVRQIRES